MNKTLKLTSVAMLTALAVLANMFTIPLTPNFSRVISFTIVVSFIAGIYLGPVSGLTVGFLGDLIAHFINPMGGMGYNWFIGLSCALTGLIAGLVFKLKLHRLIKLVIALMLSFVICTTLLNNFGLWLQIIVGVKPSPSGLIQFFTMDKTDIRKTFWAFTTARTPVALLNVAINGVILAVITQSKILDKLIAKLSQKGNPTDKQTETPNKEETTNDELMTKQTSTETNTDNK